ncbi:MAG: hypothetical protein RL266_822, partial [Bacteroidota bacterium]
MRNQYFSLLLTAIVFAGLTPIVSTTDAYSQCSNVTSAGSISASTPSGCGTFNPGIINSVSLPSGGSGTLEYVWLSSTNGGSSYTAISNSNAATYDPGSISQTTWYRRCARRSGCSSYAGESNWVQVSVTSCITPPSNPVCAQGSFLWQNNVNVNNLSGSNGLPQTDVRFVDGSVTSFVIPGPYPAAFSSAVTVSITEAVSWDGYTTRATTGDQPNEQWKIVFKKNGSVVHQTAYTGDVATGLTSAEWKGSLGSNIYLPNGTDQIVLVHYEDPTLGSGSASSANSVVPVSVCISYTPACSNVTSAGSIGSAQSGCSPFDPALITSISLPSGGSGTLEYVWLQSYDGGSTYTVINGATSSTYDPGSITQSTWYRRCARRSGCTSYVGESNWVKMTVTGPCCDNVTSAGSIGSAQSGCSPFDPALITSISLPSGGSGTLEYVWLQSYDGGSTYTVITGATSSTYDPSSITQSTWYRRCARRSGCTSYVGESNWVKMTVTGPCCDNVTNAGQIGNPQTGCSPFDPAALVSLADPSGGTGSLEYVWLQSTNGGTNYTVISGATSSTYDPGTITQTTWYRRCARRSGCSSYVGESNWVQITVGTSGVTLSVSKTDVSCNSDNSHECEAVHYQNGSHAVWINTLPGTSTNFKFENNSGNLVEYPDGTASVSGIIYNTSDPAKRWQVDVRLTDKKTWSQWQAAGGSWKGTASIVGNNYVDWAYYEMDAANSRMIGLGTYAGKELSLQRMSAAPQFRVQVGTAANDKNGNYGLSLWFDYSGDYTGHGDFNFDLQNCVDHGCDGSATASASGGTAPYTYMWDNGMTTSSIDGLCAGQYCVTVVDANGCTSDEECVTVGDKPSCCNVTDPGEIAG